jgi:hypothetical protein
VLLSGADAVRLDGGSDPIYQACIMTPGPDWTAASR